MKSILYLIQAIFVYIFILIIKFFGIKKSRIILSFIFKKLGPLIKSEKIIDKNINIVFGNLENENKKKIKEGMWSNYGKTFVEYFFLNKFLLNNSHITIKGKEKLEEIKKKDKPVIFVSAHLANFELMSMELVKAGFKLATLYRPLNNYFINPLMEHLRRKNICKNQIPKGLMGTRKILNYLKNNYNIALMLDQRVSEGSKIHFFNNEAWTTTLPAQIALKYDCEIVPIYIKRIDKDKFFMEIHDPLNYSKNKKENKITISKDLNKIIEKMILKNPEQWIWTHNRWK